MKGLAPRHSLSRHAFTHTPPPPHPHLLFSFAPRSLAVQPSILSPPNPLPNPFTDFPLWLGISPKRLLRWPISQPTPKPLHGGYFPQPKLPHACPPSKPMGVRYGVSFGLIDVEGLVHALEEPILLTFHPLLQPETGHRNTHTSIAQKHFPWRKLRDSKKKFLCMQLRTT